MALLTMVLASESVSAHPLIPQSYLNSAIKRTKTYELAKTLRFIHHHVPDSEIASLQLEIPFGTKDLSAPKGQVALGLLGQVLGNESKNLSREQVFAVKEKFSIHFGCGAGLESFSCSLGTVEAYWEESLKLFIDLLSQAKLSQKSLDLAKQQKMASLQAHLSNPERYANDVVNRVFYPKGHPYYLDPQSELDLVQGIELKDLEALLKQLWIRRLSTIVYVGSRPAKKTYEGVFKGIGGLFEGKPLNSPSLAMKRKETSKNRTSFAHRPTQTAYLRIKYDLPKPTKKMSALLTLFSRVLSENLKNEVRTKRSLSYSVYSSVFKSRDIGFGVIGASSSKPKETLQAIADVIQEMKDNPLKKEDLEKMKTIFVTGFYLGLETHGSIGNTLLNSHFNYGSAHEAFKLVKNMEKIEPKHLQKMAQSFLKNFYVGIVFDKERFDPKWFELLVPSSQPDTQ